MFCVSNERGVDDSLLTELREVLSAIAARSVGDVMGFQLADLAREALVEPNKRALKKRLEQQNWQKGSLHQQMKLRKGTAGKNTNRRAGGQEAGGNLHSKDSEAEDEGEEEEEQEEEEEEEEEDEEEEEGSGEKAGAAVLVIGGAQEQEDAAEAENARRLFSHSRTPLS